MTRRLLPGLFERCPALPLGRGDLLPASSADGALGLADGGQWGRAMALSQEALHLRNLVLYPLPNLLQAHQGCFQEPRLDDS